MPIEDRQEPGGRGIRHAGQTTRRKLFARRFTRLCIAACFGLLVCFFIELWYQPWVALLCAFCAGVAVGGCRAPEEVEPG
jgi:uncharacterized membrane protein YjjP (DUF1212 family)